MCSDFESALGILEFVVDNLGRKSDITIEFETRQDSPLEGSQPLGPYENDEVVLRTLKILGTPDKPISLEDIYTSFVELQSLIDRLNEEPRFESTGLVKVNDGVYHTMSDFFDMEIDVLKLLIDIYGKTHNVIINSEIHKHSLPRETHGNITIIEGLKLRSINLNDIIIIKGTKIKPINFDDVYKLYKRMQKQIDEFNDDRSYFYEGLSYNKDTGMYQICWGS
jgi:hypothetical protein